MIGTVRLSAGTTKNVAIDSKQNFEQKQTAIGSEAHTGKCEGFGNTNL